MGLMQKVRNAAVAAGVLWAVRRYLQWRKVREQRALAAQFPSLPPVGGKVVEVLGLADEEEVLDVMTRSFSGTATTEPEWTFDWFVGPQLRGKYDDPQRLKCVRFLQRFLFLKGAEFGGIVLGARAREGAPLGAVCVAFPYPAGAPGWAAEAWQVTRLIAKYFRSVPPWENRDGPYGRKAPERLDCMDKTTKKMHGKHAPGGHWYVSIMAVDPSAQGQGLCGLLMRQVSEAADRQGLPCYLEASGDRNRAVYRHLGYTQDELYTLSVDGDDDGNEHRGMYAMVRQPQPSQRARASGKLG